MRNAQLEEPRPQVPAAPHPVHAKRDPALRILVACFIAVAVVFSGVAIANTLLPHTSIKDYIVWLDTGQRMLHGAPIYPIGQKFPFIYPPTAAVLLVVPSLLGTTGLVVLLTAITALAWFSAVLISVRLTTGSWRRADLLLYALPSLCVSVYLWSNFHLGQPSVVLLALMVGAFLALQTKRQPLAGFLIALAAGIKAFPVIAIVYLIYRRYWVATATLVVSLAFLLIVLPAPFRGFNGARHDLKLWTTRMLNYEPAGIGERPPRSFSWKSQSIISLTNRLLRPIDADNVAGPHRAVYVNVANLSFAQVNAIIAAIALLLGLTYLAVMPPHGARTTETDAIEFALFILLMLVFTPLAYGYNFVALLFPLTVIVARLRKEPSRPLLISTSVALFLLALTIPLQKPAQLYGNVVLATLILFGALARELWQLKQKQLRRAGGGD